MKVLFVCKGNAFRSQMAEAIYNRLTNTKDASSVGTYVGAPEEPEGSFIRAINKSDDFIEMMLEKGFDLRTKKTVRLTPEMVRDADLVISMAEEPYVPEYLKNDPKVLQWQVLDVQAGGLGNSRRDEMENRYDLIREKIEDLISQTKENG